VVDATKTKKFPPGGSPGGFWEIKAASVCRHFLAQRADTETAAALGVYLHGLSGDTALKKCGFRGMMAGDIVNGLRDFLAENQL